MTFSPPPDFGGCSLNSLARASKLLADAFETRSNMPASLGAVTKTSFDLKAPAVSLAAPADKIEPFHGAGVYAPDDVVALASASHRIMPSLALLTFVGLDGFDAGARPRLVEGDSLKVDQDALRALAKLDLTLSVGEWCQAYVVCFTVLQQICDEAAAKHFATAFERHKTSILARLSERSWPVLRLYDFTVRRRFFEALALADRAAAEGKAPAAPEVPSWDESLFNLAANHFHVKASTILDPRNFSGGAMQAKIEGVGDALRGDGAAKAVRRLVEDVVDRQKERDLEMIEARSKAAASTATGVGPAGGLGGHAASSLFFAPQGLPPLSPALLPSPSQFLSGTLPNQHPNQRLLPPTPVQQQASAPSPARCGLCGGGHSWGVCRSYNPTIIQREGMAVTHRPTGQMICASFNAGACRAKDKCKFSHFCARCGDTSTTHGFFSCSKTASSFPPAAAFPSAAPSAVFPSAQPAVAGTSRGVRPLIQEIASADEPVAEPPAKRAKSEMLTGVPSMSELLKLSQANVTPQGSFRA